MSKQASNPSNQGRAENKQLQDLCLAVRDARETMLYTDGSVVYAKSTASRTVEAMAPMRTVDQTRRIVGPVVQQDGTWDLEMGPIITENQPSLPIQMIPQPSAQLKEETATALGDASRPEAAPVTDDGGASGVKACAGCLVTLMVMAFVALPFCLLLTLRDKETAWRVIVIVIACAAAFLICSFGSAPDRNEEADTADTAATTGQAKPENDGLGTGKSQDGSAVIASFLPAMTVVNF